MAVAVLAGALGAAQSRINGELAIQVGNGLLAATVALFTGLLVISVLTLGRPGSRGAFLRTLPHQLRVGRLRWWHLLGGLFGAVFVASTGIVVPVLGVALFTVIIFAGNTVASVATDAAGIGPGGRQPITRRRVVAAVGTVVGVAVAVSDRLSAGSFATGALALALVAGAVTGVQPALNGQVAVATEEPLVGALVNFVVGGVALAVALTVAYATGSSWSALPAPWDKPVLWLGGLLGLAFILGTTIVVGPLGVLLLSLLVTAGSLVGALASDLLAPVPGVGVSLTLILGVAVTGLSAAYAAGRPRSPAGVGR